MSETVDSAESNNSRLPGVASSILSNREMREKIDAELLKITELHLRSTKVGETGERTIGSMHSFMYHTASSSFRYGMQVAINHMLSMSVEEIERRTGVKLKTSSEPEKIRANDPIVIIEDCAYAKKGDTGVVLGTLDGGSRIHIQIGDRDTIVPATSLAKVPVS